MAGFALTEVVPGYQLRHQTCHIEVYADMCVPASPSTKTSSLSFQDFSAAGFGALGGMRFIVR